MMNPITPEKQVETPTIYSLVHYGMSGPTFKAENTVDASDADRTAKVSVSRSQCNA